MIIANFVSTILMTALSIVGFCLGPGGYFNWLYLAVTAAVIYSTTNNIILYKAKKAYDDKNHERFQITVERNDACLHL